MNPDALVFNLDGDKTIVCFYADRYRVTLIRIFRGIGQEIRKYLLNTYWITHDKKRLIRAAENELLVAFLAMMRGRKNRIVEYRLEIHTYFLQIDLSFRY